VRRLRQMVDALQPLHPKERKPRIVVRHGDANVELLNVLKSKEVNPKLPTFALLDQRTFECKWRTVEALARYKNSCKIELFYFLASGWFARAVSGLKDQTTLVEWWGRSDSAKLAKMTSFDRAFLLAERFRKELGYSSAIAWPIYRRESSSSSIMYHMIHATDHPKAPSLMCRAYRKAVTPAFLAEQQSFDIRQIAEFRREIDEEAQTVRRLEIAVPQLG
jgi:three-Cys-motif partner protein